MKTFISTRSISFFPNLASLWSEKDAPRSINNTGRQAVPITVRLVVKIDDGENFHKTIRKGEGENLTSLWRVTGKVDGGAY